jgi:hypothetical protein
MSLVTLFPVWATPAIATSVPFKIKGRFYETPSPFREAADTNTLQLLSDKLNLRGTLAAVSLILWWKEQSPLFHSYSANVTLSTIMSPPCLR